MGIFHHCSDGIAISSPVISSLTPPLSSEMSHVSSIVLPHVPIVSIVLPSFSPSNHKNKNFSRLPDVFHLFSHQKSYNYPPIFQIFEEILAAVRSGAMPSVMPVRAGSALSRPGPGGGFTLPARAEPQGRITRTTRTTTGWWFGCHFFSFFIFPYIKGINGNNHPN